MMNEEKNSEAFYKKLKSQLYDTGTWPSEYLYKFIVVSNKQKITEIEDIFKATSYHKIFQIDKKKLIFLWC